MHGRLSLHPEIGRTEPLDGARIVHLGGQPRVARVRARCANAFMQRQCPPVARRSVSRRA
jgi:hypothetical protein